MPPAGAAVCGPPPLGCPPSADSSEPAQQALVTVFVGSPLQRYTGRREDYAETHRVIASLIADRSARRSTRRKPSTELVLARQTAY